MRHLATWARQRTALPSARVSARASAILALALALAAAPAASAQAPSGGLSIGPSRVEGVARAGAAIGPFAVRNTARSVYDVTVFPVLLDQRRDGAALVRDDARARAAAARLLAVTPRRLTLAPGASRSVAVRVRRAPEAGVYAGVVFSARPPVRESEGAQITNVLRLNALVLLRPPRSLGALRSGAVRLEQAGPRRLRAVVPLTNRGNVLQRLRGTIRVRDEAGRLVAQARMSTPGVLPGATVDAAADLRGRLVPGTYELDARLTPGGGGASLRAEGGAELFGVNEVLSRRARLERLDSPEAREGDQIGIEATYRNTGNVPFAPRAELEVRAVRDGESGPVVRRTTLEVERTEPGRRGDVRGGVELPDGAEAGASFDVALRLRVGADRLDEQSARVVVQPTPSLPERVEEFVRTNAVVLVVVLLAALLVAALLLARYVRRLRALARSPTRRRAL